MTDLIGKTIARVDTPAYDDYLESNLLVLWFTDGTAVKLRAEGYEADGIGLEPTTAADLDAEFVASIEHLINSQWDAHVRALRKHAECLQAAASYGGEDTQGYRDWYQDRYGMSAFARALRSEYLYSMRDFMNQSSCLLWSDSS